MAGLRDSFERSTNSTASSSALPGSSVSEARSASEVLRGSRYLWRLEVGSLMVGNQP